MALKSSLLAAAAFSALVAAETGPANPNFDGIDPCAYDCLDKSLAASPLSSCKDTDTTCQCQDYIILSTLQSCLTSTNDCTTNRYDALTFIQDVCDNAITGAAYTTGSSTETVVETLAPSTVVAGAPTPTDLAEAESALASASPGVSFVGTSNLGSGNSGTNTQDTSSGAVPIVGKSYRTLSGQAIAGIAFATIVGAVIFFMAGFCFLEKRKRKARKAAENGETPTKFTGDPKPGKNKRWFSKKGPNASTRSVDEDEDEPVKGETNYYAHDKEMGLMVNTEPMVVVPIPGARTRVSMITADMQMLSNNAMSVPPSRGVSPEPPMPAAVPSASPQRTSPPRMSLTYATKPQRPSVISENPVIVFPQATVNEYSSESARNSLRYSAQSMNASNLQPSGPGFSMNIIPATPQMNGVSPVSPSGPKDEIFNYYSSGPDGSVGMAQTTEGSERRYTYQQHGATNSQSSQQSGPPTYQFPDNRSRPYNAPEQPTNGLIMPPRAIRSSSRSPSPHSHNHNMSTSTTSTSIFDNDQPSAASTSSTTVNSRGNSQAWRASVERAADRAMDRVRHSRCEDVPEDEEHLTKKENVEGLEEGGVDGRGRSKWRTSLQDMLSSAPPKQDTSSRSISVSPAPSARSSSGSARSGSVGARDSTSSKRAMERRQSRRASGAVMMV